MGVPDKIITLDIKTFEGYETNYAENFEYESTVNIYTDRTETTTQTLTRLHTPEGYITTVSSPQYHYYRRDHLGNNREVWLANTNTTLQRTQYYPSGLPWAEGLGAGVQNKKYNGKEFVEMHGWDTYDYIFRNMHSAKMRFDTPDALMELHYDVTPYVYCLNNPMYYVDPLGLDTCKYNPVDDTFTPINNKLNELTVKPKTENNGNSNSTTFINFMMLSTNNMAQFSEAHSKSMYTPNEPWRAGHYLNVKGENIPLKDLRLDTNGKYPKGAIKRINNIKADFRLLNRTVTAINVMTIGYDSYKLFNDLNIENGLAVTIDGVSYMFWEVGIVASYVQTNYEYSKQIIRPQIMNNLQNKENPMNNVFIPGSHWSNLTFNSY